MNTKDANCIRYLVALFVLLREIPGSFFLSAFIRRKICGYTCTLKKNQRALFMRMFLPLEKCHPLVGAIAVGGEDHTYQFPGLLTEIVAGGFKFLSGPGALHAILP